MIDIARKIQNWTIQQATFNKIQNIDNTPSVAITIIKRMNTFKLMEAVLVLKNKGYKPLPLKRILIPKKNSNQKRPLSIPAMKDRTMQALWLLALEPIAEERADKNSYGFRPKRSPADAIAQCYLLLCRKTSAQWIFEGDIKACFDRISSDWLLENIPMNKTILKKFLLLDFLSDIMLQ